MPTELRGGHQSAMCQNVFGVLVPRLKNEPMWELSIYSQEQEQMRAMGQLDSVQLT